jgi:MFS family permease
MIKTSHQTRTLYLTGMLHAFTHVYQVALLPLYLLIQADLNLSRVDQATLLVTVMGVAYFLPSYPMGWLADKFSKKKLLALGLLINGAGFVVLGLATNYPLALAGVVIAGFGGSFFHPAATALIASLFPAKTGRALGLIGIGAGVGFFIGPIYTGWRAATAGWRAPVIELGIAGILGAALFWWLADEERPHAPSTGTTHTHTGLFPTTALWSFFLAAALCFSLRDFGGHGFGSLGSLFLQKGNDLDPKHTGFLLSIIFLAAAISNPVFGHLSDGGRKRWVTIVLSLAALLVIAMPHAPQTWLGPMFAAYGFFFMGSYPVVEAMLMESVPAPVRGRVFGLWITIGGLLGNLSHWFVGNWVKRLGADAYNPASYHSAYALLGGLIALALLGVPCLHAIRRREEQAVPGTATPEAQR